MALDPGGALKSTRRSWLAALGVLLLGLGAPDRTDGQVLAAVTRSSTPPATCLSEGLADRLRSAHPLGAAGIEGLQCLGESDGWVATSPMDRDQRRAWEAALGRLASHGMAECRRAAAVLAEADQAGLVSVWTPADTAGGMVFFGATYVTPSATTLAIQFWAPAFERSTRWLTGALAHEGFHAMRPDASESEAHDFGAACAGGSVRLVSAPTAGR